MRFLVPEGGRKLEPVALEARLLARFALLFFQFGCLPLQVPNFTDYPGHLLPGLTVFEAFGNLVQFVRDLCSAFSDRPTCDRIHIVPHFPSRKVNRSRTDMPSPHAVPENIV